MIYVGTSRGLIAIFDFNQNLKLILMSAATGLEHGAVTCLDLHISNERLVCGHQRGFIVFWDLVKGKPIKIINADRNAKETAIAFVQFLDSENEVVAVDDKVPFRFCFRPEANFGTILN